MKKGSWARRKVLVTGADGFIGSHLTERLASLGAEVRAMALYNSFGRWGWLDEADPRLMKGVEVVLGDVTDEGLVRELVRGCDCVFHLAALIAIPYSYRAPDSYVRTNVLGTLNVVRAAGEAGAERIVHTSTSEVYGTARYVPIDEAHPLQGQSPYSASKIGADMTAMSLHLSMEYPVVTLRPFNTYGPRQSARAVIPTIAAQLLSGARELRLGSLSPRRDFTFVGDTVEAFLCAAESPKAVGRTINAGSGKDVSIGELAALLQELTGSSARIVEEERRVRPEASEVQRLQADATLARKLLGWEPKVGLRAGLERTLAWLRGNLARYRPEVYHV